MGIQDIIALSIAAAAALFAGRAVWRTINKGACSGSCGCSANRESSSEGPAASPRVARKPLVTIDQVGLPQRTEQPCHSERRDRVPSS